MKFRYRLAPLLKVAERELVAKQNIFNQLEQQHSDLGKAQEHLRGLLTKQESGLSQFSDGSQAVYFFQRRNAMHNEVKDLQEQRDTLEELMQACLVEVAAAKREVYRLELIRDKMKAEFRANLQREEDKELDEMGTLRHGRKSSGHAG